MRRVEAFLQATVGKPTLIEIAAMGSQWDSADRKPYAMVGAIAVVEIKGLLGNEWYCQTEYGDLQDEVAQAIADPAVLGICLLVDSPGGYTDGAFECAAALAAAAKQKPMYAVVAGVAYSGAYLLASQAEQIYLASAVTGGAGSIGVYCGHADYSSALEKAGIKITLISAGEGKTDGNPYEPLSPEARAGFKTNIDRLYGEFVGAVARGRDMTADAVVALGAHRYDGSAAAIGAKLVDQVGGVQEAILALGQQAGANGFSARAGGVKEKTMDQAAIDKLVSDARAAGFADAQEISELCAVAGKPDKVQVFLQEKKTAAQVRTALLTERASAAGAELNLGITPGADAEGKGKGNGGEFGKPEAWGAVLETLGFKKKGEK
jgi:signal peptide peptidase SppA